MGSKGMVSVDHQLKGRVVCLRPSMIKFEAPESRAIEIARAFDRPGRYFLNRPLIMLMEGLGVSFDVFKKYQDQAVEFVQSSGESLVRAATVLEGHGLGTSYRLPSVMQNLAKLGVQNLCQPVYNNMLKYAVHHIMRELKNHARIPVPGAVTLVGVADVHKLLQPNEVFACVKPIDGPRFFLEGPVLISRSPTIHPGDIQMAQAIGKPPEGSAYAKESLSNTIVFSVRGECCHDYLEVEVTSLSRQKAHVLYPPV
jgi:RNA-dependent RNA polymerase